MLDAQAEAQALAFAEDRDLRVGEQRRPVYERFRSEWFNLVGGWIDYLNCLGVSGRGGCRDALGRIDLARAELWRSYHNVAVYGTSEAITAASELLGYVSTDRERELASWGGADRLADASFGSEAPFIPAYAAFLRAMCVDTSADAEVCADEIEVVNLGVVTADLQDAAFDALDGIVDDYPAPDADLGTLGDYLANELPSANLVVSPPGEFTIQPVPLDPPNDGDPAPPPGGEVGIEPD